MDNEGEKRGAAKSIEQPLEPVNNSANAAMKQHNQNKGHSQFCC